MALLAHSDATLRLHRSYGVIASLGISLASLTGGTDVCAQPTKPAPVATTARAGLSKAELKSHYAAGESKFKAGDYAGALVEFKLVDGTKPTPQSARYIALCSDKLHDYEGAAQAYDRFVAAVQPVVQAQKDATKRAAMQVQQDEAKKRADDIRAMPGKVHLETAPPGAAITVDDKPGSASPADLELAPGKHVLKLTAEGREPVQREIEVAFASTQSLKVDLPAKPEPPAPATPPVAAAPAPTPTPAPPPEPKSPPSLVPAYVTGGLAVIAAGVGTAFGVMALSDHSNFLKNPTNQTADSGENHALISDMAFGIALTFGVTSAVLFLSKDSVSTSSSNSVTRVASDKKPESGISITPVPIVSAHGGGAGAIVRF